LVFTLASVEPFCPLTISKKACRKPVGREVNGAAVCFRSECARNYPDFRRDNKLRLSIVAPLSGFYWFHLPIRALANSGLLRAKGLKSARMICLAGFGLYSDKPGRDFPNVCP